MQPSVGAGAAFTKPGEFDTKGEHATEDGGFWRDRKLIEFGGCQVADDSAADADVVVMRVRVGIEVDGLAQMPVGSDQVEIVKEPQGPAHSIEGYRGHSVTDRVVDGFRIGVIGARSNFSDDLDALLGEFDSGFVGFSFEMRHALFDFAWVNFHFLHPNVLRP